MRHRKFTSVRHRAGRIRRGLGRFIHKARLHPASNTMAPCLLEAMEPRVMLSGDLAVTSAVAPSTAVLGNEITVSWTVENVGDTATDGGYWCDRVFLSTDTIWDSHGMSDEPDGELGYLYYDGGVLDPGSSYTMADQTFTLPGGYDGDAYLLFVADSYWYENDADWDNNVHAVPISVSTPDVDLRITNTSAPNGGKAGSDIDLSWTVRNAGSVAAASFEWEWEDSVYLSTDAALDMMDDDYIASVSHTTGLAGGATYTKSITGTVPNVEAGEYYLIFGVDKGWSNAQAESDETNNIVAVPFTVTLPNVDLQAVSDAPDAAVQGDVITVSWTTTNHGTEPAESNWWDYVYLSTDATYDQGVDTYLGAGGAPAEALAAGASFTQSIDVTLPADAVGDLYLIYSINGGDSQSETDTTNNIVVEAIQIAALSVDLVPAFLDDPGVARPGENLWIDYRVVNTGSDVAEADGYDYLYLSTDADLDIAEDTELTYRWTSNDTPLAAGASYDSYFSCEIPDDVVAGAYYLIMAADGLNHQAETDDANNIVAIAVDIGTPDLTITDAAVPASGDSSAPIEISWTVANQGDRIPGTTWYDYAYLSNDASVDGSDTLLGWFSIDDQQTLAPGDDYTRTETVTIPNGAEGQYIVIVTDRTSDVVESDEGDNQHAEAILIGSADLSITAAAGPTAAVLGETVSISYTVANDGDAPAAAAWYDYFYLSEDALLDPGDMYLTYQDASGHRPLAIGGDYTVERNLYIGSGLPTHQYLLIKTDGSATQGESDETDNVYALPMAVDAADLTITADAPASAGWGDVIDVEWTVVNDGSGAAVKGWTDAVYLSTDTVFDAGDVALTGASASGETPLAAAGTYTRNTSVSIPSGYSGAYYLVFVADAYSQLPEFEETNNSVAVAIDLDGADLVLSATTADAANVSWGQTVGLSWTVTNSGNRPATAVWSDYVYLSDDPVYDPADIHLASFAAGGPSPLPIGQSYQTDAAVTIPGGYVGAKYLVVVSNLAETQGETDAANNAQAVEITILGADLEIGSPTGPDEAVWGEPIDLSWGVTNIGVGDALAAWTDRVYLSADDALDGSDILVAQHAAGTSPLAGGSHYDISMSAALPAGLVGPAYLLFVADAGAQQPEGDPNNNVAAREIHLLAPDLEISSPVGPAEAIWGQSVHLEWTVANLGDGEAIGGWADQVYLSTDATFDEDDIRLTHVAGGALEAGGAYVVTRDVVVPASFLGDGYLLFIADAGGNRSETDETNNLQTLPISLAAPDLAVEYGSAPDAVVFGQNFDVSWKVTNLSPSDAETYWYDYIYLSDDMTLDAGDRYVGYDWTDGLVSGDAYVKTRTLRISSGTPGDYYLLYSVNHSHSQGESDYANNMFAEPITLGAPDLAVSAPTAPAAAAWGQSIDVGWTVANLGSVDAPAYWSDAVYLSSDTVLDGEDQWLGALSASAHRPLAAGASYTAARTVAIPRGAITGEVYLLFAADAYDAQNETDPANNVVSRAITIGSADLVAAIDAASTPVVFGESVDLTWTVTNTGGAATRSQWIDKVYLSSDATVGDDLLLAEFPAYAVDLPLDAGGFYTRTESITIPLRTDLTDGDYHLLVHADSGWAVTELDESNNRAFSDAVALMLPNLPDLVVSDIAAPATGHSGQAVELSWTLTNAGAGDATGSWVDRVYVSTDDAVGGDLHIGNFRYTGVLAAGESVVRTQNVTLPADIEGDAWFVVRTNDDEGLFEHVATTNNASIDETAVDVTLRTPNLQVSAVLPPETAASGREMVIEYTVTNSGNAATSSPIWYDRVYLSLDNLYQYGDIFLATVPNGSYLNPGDSYTNTVVATIPDGVEGSYHIVVKADTYDRVTELGFEDDNVSGSTAFPVELTPPADVQIVASRTIGMPFSGQPLQVNWTVANEGASPTGASTWTDRIYLSEDDALDTSEDFYLTTYTHQGELRPEASYAATASVTLPEGVSGAYHLLIVTDYGNAVFEHTYEVNNVEALPLTVTLTPPPDLEIESLTAPVSAVAGQSIDVSYAVGNHGSVATTGWAWSDSIYASIDDVFDPVDDVLIHQATHYGDLAVGQSYTVDATFELPHTLEGAYTLFVVANSNAGVFELDTDNNVQAASAALDVLQRPADLVVSGVALPSVLRAGQGVYVEWTVVNQGSGATTRERWSDRLYLSADTTLNWQDISLGSWEHDGALDAGESYQGDEMVVIPATWSGEAYLLVVADVASNVVELDHEDNNLTASDPVTVEQYSADLQITAVDAPLTASSGEEITISWTVRNAGAGTTSASSWYDCVYLSDDDVFDAENDLHLDITTRRGSLDPEGVYTGGATFTLDADLEGEYRLLVVADAHGQVAESDETNNVVASSPIAVTLTPTPDLVVESIVSPAAIVSGQPFDFSWTVRNQGAGALSVARYDTFYLSRDLIFDPGVDTNLGYEWVNESLPSGSSSTHSTELVIPAGLSGPYYVFVVTDERDRAYERDGEDNNVTPTGTPADVSVAPPADLVAGTIDIPAETVPGQTVVLTYTVTNAGANDATGSWYDALYLSSDTTWDIADRLIGRVRHYTGVLSGGSYTETLEAPLPGVDPGLYHVILRSDIRNHIIEADEDNNISASLDQADIDAEELALGVTATSELQQGLARFYRMDVAADQTLAVVLTSDQVNAANRLYIAHGRVPTPTDFDYASTGAFLADVEVVVPSTDAGTYYVMAQGEYVSGDGQTCQITADVIPFSVRSLSIDEVGDAGPVTLKINGARYTTQTTFALIADDGVIHPATNVWIDDSAAAFATFDLTDAALGVYDVRAADPNGSSAVLADAVTVIPGADKEVDARFEGPSTVRFGSQYQTNLYYGNIGVNDSVAPLIWLGNETGTPMSLVPGSYETPLGMLILGASNEGPAGVLRPGELYSVPIYYQAATMEISYSAVDIYYADDLAAIDWDFFEPFLRPEEMADDQWEPVWAQVQANIGDTMGELVATLAADASLLPASTGSPRHPGNLFRMEIDRAAAQLTTSITGRCAADELDLVVAGAQVFAHNRDTDEVFQATVLNDGSFRLVDLSAGVYDLDFENAVIASGGSGLSVADGDHLADVSVELTHGASLAGFVRDGQTGDPIADMLVTLTSDIGVSLQAVSDASGRFGFLGLDLGAYSLTAGGDAYARAEVGGLAIDSLDDALTQDVLLDAEASLRGVAVFEAGGPDSALNVYLINDIDRDDTYSVQSDYGSFCLSSLPAGAYDVVLQSSGYLPVTFDDVTVGAGEDVDLGEIDLQLAAALSGTITSYVSDITTGMLDVVLIHNGVEIQHAVPSAEGYFYFTNIDAGAYAVDVLDGSTYIGEEIALAVAHGEQRADLAIGVYDGAAIGGTVRDVVTDEPVAGVRVTLVGPDGLVGSVHTDADGLYRFEHLDAGDYVVTTGRMDESLGATVTVADIDAGEYAADLGYERAAMGLLQGLLRTSDGQAVSDGLVSLYRGDEFVVTTTTDENGRYEFVIAVAGDYTVSAGSAGASYPCVEGLAVSLGTTVSQDLTAGSGSIRTAVDALAAGEVAYVTIYQRIQDQWAWIGYALATADEPLHQFDDLAAGEYRLQTTTSDGRGFMQILAVSDGVVAAPSIVLTDWADVAGAVVDGDGAPVVGASVVLTATTEGVDLAYTTTTNAQGDYALPIVNPAYAYDLVVTAKGLQPSITPIASAPASGLRHDLILTPAASTISGRVVNADGLPLGVGTVTIADAAGRILGSTAVAGDGTFAFASIVGVDLRLTIAQAGYDARQIALGAVTNGQTEALGDLTLDYLASYRYTGDLSLVEMPADMELTDTGGWTYHSPGSPGWFSALLSSQPKLSVLSYEAMLNLTPPANCPWALPVKAEAIESWKYQDASYNWVLQCQDVLKTLVKAEAGASLVNGLAFAGKISSIVLNARAVIGGIGMLKQAPKLAGSQWFHKAGPAFVSELREVIGAAVTAVTNAYATVQKVSSAPSPQTAGDYLALAMTSMNEALSLVGNGLTLLVTLAKDKGAAILGGGLGIQGLINDLMGIQDTIQYGYDAFVEGYNGIQGIIAAKGQLDDAVELYKSNHAAYASDLSYYYSLVRYCNKSNKPDPDDDNPPIDPPKKKKKRKRPPDYRRYQPGVWVSLDPNDILGPEGVGDQNFINPAGAMAYTIRFENDPTATAPAQHVVVTQQFDDDLDWRSFRVDDIGWGDFRLELDADMPILSQRIDLTASHGFFVDVAAFIDIESGLATWDIQTIDPVTGEPPLDPAVGFLPPNNDDGVGDGFVSYQIQPKADAVSGTRIDALATIVFDVEAPLDTPAIFHTLDLDAPLSSVTALSASTGENNFLLSWSGNDSDGSGVAAYDIYVSVDEGPYQDWLIGTELTSAVYPGQAEHRYDFYAVAVDNVDNRESAPLTFDARTYVTTGAIPPTADDDDVAIDEDSAATAIDVLANDTTDPEFGQSMTITAVTQGAHGVVAITGGGTGLTYHVDADYYGADSFTYTITDDDGLTDTATVAVAVANTPDAPSAMDDVAAIDEDSTAAVLNVLANDVTTPDPMQTLSVTAVTQPAHGEATIAADGLTVSYAPDADYYGSDAFTYTITDADGLTDTAAVAVTVANTPDAPVAVDDEGAVDEDAGAQTIDVLANDAWAPDPAEALTIVAVTDGAHGVVAITGDGTALTYRPAPDYFGVDSFTYTIADSTGLTATAAATITVAPVADPPLAVDDVATIEEDAAPAAIDVLANDGSSPDEPQALAVTAVTQGEHGAVVITGGGTGLTYQPDADFYGTDAFTYAITDEDGLTDVAAVTVTVTNLPDAPAAGDDTGVLVDESGGPQAVDVLANDTHLPDPAETLTIIAVTQGGHGAVVITGGGTGLTYEPDPYYNGGDSFTYTIADEDGLTDEATVDLTVLNIPDPPAAGDDVAVIDEDAPAAAIDVLANDTYLPDPVQAFAVTAVTQGEHGQVVITNNGADLTYEPEADYFGIDAFTYTITDEDGLTDTATVTVTVTPNADPPAADDDAARIDEDDPATVIDVLANDTYLPDPAQSLTITAVAQGEHGAVVITGDGTALTYEPEADFFGVDAFTYTITDDDGLTDTAAVVVTVVPTADDPTAADDSEVINEDAGAVTIDVLANDTYLPDGPQTLTLTAVTQGEHGAVTVTDGGTRLTYEPDADYFGADTFTYTLVDEDGLTAVAEVSVTVAPIADPPIAADDAAALEEDAAAVAIDVLANDSFLPDAAETLTITAVTQGAGGTVVITGGGTGLTYEPNADFYGSDAFTYVITDADGLTDAATVAVTVANLPDDPTAVADAAVVLFNAAPTAVDVLANDTWLPDPAQTLAVTAVTQGDHGAVVITDAGAGVTYEPDLEYFGSDAFFYTITDADGRTDTARVDITVPVPHACDLVPEITANTLPVAIVAGAKVSGRVNVRIANLGNEPVPAGQRVDVYVKALGPNGEVTLGELEGFSVAGLAPESTRSAAVAVNSLEPLAVGVHAVTIQVVAQGALDEIYLSNNRVTAAQELTVAEPFTDLAADIDQAKVKLPEAFTSGDGTKITLPVGVTNTGNVPLASTQLIDVQVFLRPLDAQDSSQDVWLDTFVGQNVSSLKPGQRKLLRLKAQVPAGVASGRYRLVAMIDSADAVAEEAGDDPANNEATSDAVTDLTKGWVDLSGVFKRVALPTAVVVGDAVKGSVLIAVANGGNVSLPSTARIDVHLAAVRQSDNAEIILSQPSNISLAKLRAGASKSVSVSVNLPDGLPVGTWDLEVRLDAGDAVAEEDETNNIVAHDALGDGYAVVSAEPFTNLVAGIDQAKVKLPAAATSGDGTKITLPVKVTNAGNIPLDRTQLIDVQVFLRPAAAADDAQDVLVQTFVGQSIRSLKPGQTKVIPLTVQIPAGVDANAYQLVAAIDTADAVTAADGDDPADNEAISDAVTDLTKGCVDLSGVFSRVVLPGAVVAGAPVKGLAQVAITNNGNVSLPSTARIDVRLVAVRRSDSAEIILGQASNASLAKLRAGAMKTVTVSANVPDGLPVGEWDIQVRLDTGAAVAEEDETNNIVTTNASGDAYAVVSADAFTNLAAAIDQAKVKLPATTTSGDGTKITLPVKVTNAGNIPLDRTQAIDVQIFLRPTAADDDAQDILVQTFVGQSIRSLKPGQTKVLTLPVQIPAGVESNAYQLVAKIDSADAVTADAGDDPADNVAVSDAATDLTEGFIDLLAEVRSVKTSSTAYAGQAVTAGVLLTNAGNVAAKGEVRVDLYLSTDTTLDADVDLLMGSSTLKFNRRPEQGRTYAVKGVLPDETPTGDYHVIARVAAGEGVVEKSADQVNNDHASAGAARVNEIYGLPELLHLADGAAFTFLDGDEISQVHIAEDPADTFTVSVDPLDAAAQDFIAFAIKGDGGTDIAALPLRDLGVMAMHAPLAIAPADLRLRSTTQAKQAFTATAFDLDFSDWDIGVDLDTAEISGLLKSTVSLLAYDQTVVTPAGTFTDAAHIKMTFAFTNADITLSNDGRIGQLSQTLTWDFWVSPSVGVLSGVEKLTAKIALPGVVRKCVDTSKLLLTDYDI